MRIGAGKPRIARRIQGAIQVKPMVTARRREFVENPEKAPADGITKSLKKLPGPGKQ